MVYKFTMTLLLWKPLLLHHSSAPAVLSVTLALSGLGIAGWFRSGRWMKRKNNKEKEKILQGTPLLPQWLMYFVCLVTFRLGSREIDYLNMKKPPGVFLCFVAKHLNTAGKHSSRSGKAVNTTRVFYRFCLLVQIFFTAFSPSGTV